MSPFFSDRDREAFYRRGSLRFPPIGVGRRSTIGMLESGPRWSSCCTLLRMTSTITIGVQTIGVQYGSNLWRRFLNHWSSQIDQIDHDLDHLVLHLPLWEVVQDLHSTDPTLEKHCARSCRLCWGPIRQHWARSYKIGNRACLEISGSWSGIRSYGSSVRGVHFCHNSFR